MNLTSFIRQPIYFVLQKKDFTPDKRKRFCSRIATGDYDAVIIGHSQFEKIRFQRKDRSMNLKVRSMRLWNLSENIKETGIKDFSVKAA